MLLEIKDLVMRFGGLVAVNELSFSVEQGQIYSIIGPNGAGKTTVLNCLSRFYTPNSGSIFFNDENLLKMRSDTVIRKGIARSFQNVELFSRMTLTQNLQIGLDHTLRASFLSSVLSLPGYRREENRARLQVDELIDLLQLRRYVNEQVNDLPFGVQKRIDMGRALISQPKLLLLDEPVAGTNPTETQELSEIILNINREKGVTVLMIEHDMMFVMSLSDRVLAIDFGRKIAEGEPSEIQNHPKVIEAYLGEEVEPLAGTE